MELGGGIPARVLSRGSLAVTVCSTVRRVRGRQASRVPVGRGCWIPGWIAGGIAFMLFFAGANFAGTQGASGDRSVSGLTRPPTKEYSPDGPYPGLEGPYQWVIGADGIPIVYYGSALGWRHNPVTTAQYGLWRFGNWVRTHDQSQLLAAEKQADWLVANQDRASGKWFYDFPLRGYGLSPPWASAMAQGQAISLLTRVWRATNTPRYLQAAAAALRPFERPVSKGGVVSFLDGHPWYEEAPSRPPSFILNGFMFTLVGLYDLQVASPSSDAGRLFTQGIDSLAYALPQFDAGEGFQYYDLRHWTWSPFPINIARESYLRLDVQLLQILDSLSPHSRFADYVGRWKARTLPQPPPGFIPLHANLLPSPGFERGLRGWHPLGSAALSRTGFHPKRGRFAATIRAGSVRRYGLRASFRGSHPAGAYALSGWLRGDRTSRGKRVRLVLVARGGGQPPKTLAHIAVRLKPRWRRVVSTGTLESVNRTRIEIRLFRDTHVLPAERFDADELTLQRLH